MKNRFSNRLVKLAAAAVFTIIAAFVFIPLATAPAYAGILEDMGDLGGMVAPRPFIVINGKDDVIFPLESNTREFGVTESLYKAAGAENMCRHIIGPEGHRFYAALGWPVFNELTGWKK